MSANDTERQMRWQNIRKAWRQPKEYGLFILLLYSTMWLPKLFCGGRGVDTKKHLSDDVLASLFLAFAFGLGWAAGCQHRAFHWLALLVSGLAIVLTFMHSFDASVLERWESEAGLQKRSTRYSSRAAIRVSVAFFSVIVWFASLNFALYQLQHDQFNGIGSFGDALYYSIITATTVGYGDISPAKPLARLSCAGETLVGLFYILIGIGRFSGMFTKERPGVETR